MATNATIDIKALVATLKAELMPELKSVIIAALEDEDATASDSTPHRRRYGKKSASDFEYIENVVFIRQYSDKTHCVYGDLKGKTDRLEVIKSFGSVERRASFNSLPCVPGAPAGWILKTDVLEEKGGVDALAKALKALKVEVRIEDSVADVHKARNEEKKTAAKSEKDENKGEKKASKPTAKPTAKATVVSIAKTIEGAHCYEPSKNEDGFEVKERTLVQHGDYYVLQSDKGAFIYVKGGVDAEFDYDVYALITKVKGDASKSDAQSAWTEIAKLGIVEAVKADKLVATVALMNAVARFGTDEDIDVIYDKIAA